MTTAEFIYSDYNSIFTISLTIMFLIALLEGITTIFGMGISSLFETIIPDIEVDIGDVDAPQGVLSKLLGWLNYGKVPVLIIFICFLTVFGVVGYSIQYALYSLTSTLFSQMIVVPIAFVVSMPFLKIFTSIIEKIMPKDESSALNEESFVGKVAVITVGNARFGSPAEAKVIDRYGQTHYFMIEPESNDIEFSQGEDVLLSKTKQNGYFAIKNNNTTLKGN